MQEGKLVTGDFRTRVQINNRPASRFTVLLPIKDSDREVTRLQEKGVQIRAERESTSFGSLIFMILPYIIIFGAWMLILRQMQAGGAKAFSFGKSKAKLLTADSPKVTFADVAGADEAKVELEEIIEFLKDPQKFTKLGGRLPKGALLVGPPGTGKTLLARAVAGEAGRPFFSMSGSDFVEMFVGVGASRVRDLFEQGKAHAPCIIFIDEIDAVGRHRGAGLGGGHDEREQTLNQLLVEMDGIESNDGVILIAATNRPDVLDPALLRPGRFDRQIVVDAPDLRGREGILKVHTRNKPIADDVNITTLARGTPGMSGADLANLVNEGALLAARRNHDKVYMVDLEDAKDKVMLGAERKSMVMSEQERKLTDYHEGGHAVCTIKTKGNDPLHKVTIVPRGRAMGLAFTLPEDDRLSITREQLEAMLVRMYGGRVAEELVFGHERVTTGASSDIQQATGLARRYVSQWGLSDAIGPILVGDNEQELFLGRELQTRREVSERTAQLVDSEVTRVIKEAYARAKETLTENLELLHTVAAALLDRETLTGEEVQQLARGETLAPRPAPPSLPAAPVKESSPAQPKPAKPPLFGGPEVAPA
jgi:cell division protease FtsH